MRWIVSLFFVSGAVGLMGEVVFNRLMTFIFGASHLATSTVLATYMGGLALGSWLLGDRGRFRGSLVKVYGGLELLVAGWFVLLAVGFRPLREALLPLLQSMDGSPNLVVLVRLAVCAGLVVLPTTLMGGSLPVLVRGLDALPDTSRALPTLYAANTLGAAVGALAASYGAIPTLGLDGTLLLCAALDGCIGLGALLLPLPLAAAAPAVAAPAPAPILAAAPVDPDEPPVAFGTRGMLALAAAQGALSFSLEVLWSHLLGPTIGVTTHGFALMLFALLLGLGLGSLWWRRLDQGRPEDGVRGFALGMALVACGVAASGLFWDSFTWVVYFTSGLREQGHFVGREAVRFAFCAAAILPAAVGLGLGLPALVGSSAAGREDDRLVGRAFALNTLGAIAGSLGTGFVLLGRVPSQTLLQTLALAAAGLAALAVRRCGEAWQPSRGAMGLLVLGLTLALAMPAWNLGTLTSGSHYHWRPKLRHDISWSREDAQSGFITVSLNAREDGGPPMKLMETNGKYEGTDGPAEFQDLFALIGASYLTHLDSAIVVGLGPARTLRTLHFMPFAQIDAVEHSPAIVAAARDQFAPISAASLDDQARVRMVVDDGRNFLQSTRSTYDYVAIAISGAAFAGASNIYSEDFFQVIRGRLRPGGVLMLWLQLHHVDPETYRDVLLSLSRVFPQVHFHSVNGVQGLLIASEAPLALRAATVDRFLAVPGLRQIMQAQEMDTLWRLQGTALVTSPGGVAQVLAATQGYQRPAVRLTDMNPRFEFDAARALATWTEDNRLEGWFDTTPVAADPPLSPLDQVRAMALRLRTAIGPGAAHRYLEGERQKGTLALEADDDAVMGAAAPAAPPPP